MAKEEVTDEQNEGDAIIQGEKGRKTTCNKNSVS